jgi:hypothetical protein
MMQNQNLEHWFTDKQTRLAEWRGWRDTLTELDYRTAIEKIAVWWKFVPLINKSVDPWREETWPTPWELVGRGEFCINAQSLGIFYTMCLQGLDCQLMLAQIRSLQETRLLVLARENKLLNYCDGLVTDIQDDVQILRVWEPSDLSRLVKV